ncbi:hypothetical protein H2204_010845 [Knufia peltigerae]|uniref:Uncharacterized protein n=1 Tax=Knufia peltigerae TaxID=1002370 RepID=A0AA39CUN1_9EURO|nr:hypothetical protein H2204_010845 [Knufia peltigerae]
MSSPRLTSPRGGGDRAPRLPAGFEYERVQLPSSRPSSRDPRQPRQSGIRGRRRPRPTSRSPLAPVFEDSSAWMDNYFYARPSVPRPSSATILRPPPSSPSSSSSPQTNNLHCTPWILNTETINTSHRCSDALFFRDSIDLQPGGYGTVAIPILPRPEPYNFGVSIMTVTPTMYTPGAPYSELNWPLMEAQGFHKFDIHHDGRSRSRPTRYTSIIRHRNIPGVDLLWCSHDPSMNSSSRTLVWTPAFEMVDMQRWARGVRDGIIGQAADMNGRVAWTEPGEGSPLEDILYGW